MSESYAVMAMSPSIAEITKALIAFHKKCPTIKKEEFNKFTKSYYASLSDILDTVLPILAECDLNLSQFPVGDNCLVTLLSHTSGEWFRSVQAMEPLPEIIDKETKEKAVKPSSIGSVITYARRYGISSVLSLNTDRDTDGMQEEVENAAKEPVKSAAQILEEQKAAKRAAEAGATSHTPPAPSTPTVAQGQSLAGKFAVSTESNATAEQVKTVKDILTELNQSKPGTTAKFKELMAASGRTTIANLSIAEADDLIAKLRLKQMEAFFDQKLKAG